ncbi:protein kinase [Myxococcus sp. K15C18031901]|uniref:serine/threonine-protein kinase n=1 Tax=Myxococcus dinghuensis TaxID=2906761 RepID=UPI0020A755ED|nr:serine/threonine-protein kinase [Myxococcus dinghuensis]MCP3097729.1 protein kinase [Myxococcus dinghuensis]
MQVGKYQLVRKLASGGMAEVFLAKAAGPMGFEKTLVLKRILPHLAEDPAFVEMFLGEARLAAQLEHPNIVQIFDFGEADGSYFLAMEFIDGPTLRKLVKRAAEVPLPPVVCAKLVSLAAEGLAFAHDFCDPETGSPLGIIHRDVSPDNILVSRQGAVKVVDFGVAKVAGQGHRTQTGVVKGKVAYMPPEQLRTLPLDRRVDVYALGVVLYELLSGRRPFDATTEASTMQAILFEPFIPVTARRADVPPMLQVILDNALAKDRDARYPDCRALQSDLEHFVLSSGEAVGAYQLSQFVTKVMGDSSTGPLMGSPAHGVVGSGGAPRPAGSGPKPLSASRSMAAPSAPLERPRPDAVDVTAPTTPAPLAVDAVLGGGAPARTPARRKGTTLPPQAGLPMEAGAGGGGGWNSSRMAAVTAPLATTPLATAKKDGTESEVAGPDEDHISTGVQVSSGVTKGRGMLVAALALGGVLAVAGVALLWPERAPSVDVKPLPVGAGEASRGKGAPPVREPTPVAEARPVAEAARPGATGDAPVAPTQPSAPPPEDPKPPEPVVVAKVEPAAPVESEPAREAASAKSSEEPSTKPARPRVAVRAPVAKGFLEIRVRPYAVVKIDGKSYGQTPLDPVELTEGKHTLKLSNADLGKDVTKVVEIKAGKTTPIRHNFMEE